MQERKTVNCDWMAHGENIKYLVSLLNRLTGASWDEVLAGFSNRCHASLSSHHQFTALDHARCGLYLSLSAETDPPSEDDDEDIYTRVYLNDER